MKTETMFSSATGDWATPQEFFDMLDEIFHFTLDPCADEKIISAKSISQKSKTDWNSLGMEKPYSAIRRMDEILDYGSKRA